MPQTTNKFSFMTAWCHGATGIGYSRLAASQICSDNSLLVDLNVAITTTVRDLSIGKDHLCCGMFGRLDFLFEAGRLLDNAMLIKTVYSTTASAIERAKELGHWIIGPDPNIAVPIPGLMQGISGIGLTLLRFAYPDIAPKILLLK